MTRTVRLLGGVALAVGVIATTAWGLDQRRTVLELRTLQEDVQATRGSIQSCQSRLAALEASFQDFDTRLSALRERVAALESADGPGGPAEQYDEYLTLFAAYNDSVQVWEARSERLRSGEAACRTLVGRHNALVDSLKKRVREREHSGNQ